VRLTQIEQLCLAAGKASEIGDEATATHLFDAARTIERQANEIKMLERGMVALLKAAPAGTVRDAGIKPTGASTVLRFGSAQR
jgi:hypothetical protein